MDFGASRCAVLDPVDDLCRIIAVWRLEGRRPWAFYNSKEDHVFVFSVDENACWDMTITGIPSTVAYATARRLGIPRYDDWYAARHPAE
jgi:hypothetical protein